MPDKKTTAKAPPVARDLRSDMANSERLIALATDSLGDLRIRFVTPWKKWILWDDRRFGRDDLEEVYEYARDIPGLIYTECAAATDKDQRARLAKWARATEDRKRLVAMLALAQPLAAVRPEDLDRDPWLLNCLNGTVNLKKGELLPACLSDFITKLAPVEFSPEAKCPRWDEFILEIMDGDSKLASFLQRAVGYSVTADTRERVLFLLFGTGSNGKSIFLKTISDVIGDYSKWTAASTLMAKRDSIPNDVAALMGIRFVVASETEKGRHLAESLIKSMTGGVDKLSARFMRAEWFSFTPEFKIWLATNAKPIVTGRDDAVWCRILLLPFQRCFHREDEQGTPKRDTALAKKLKAEHPGILNWIVKGCLAWQREGLRPPDAVKIATKEYRDEQDHLTPFLDERCVFMDGVKVTSSKLQKEYRSWCDSSGEKPLSFSELAAELRSRGCTAERVNRGRGWSGVGLRETGVGP